MAQRSTPTLSGSQLGWDTAAGKEEELGSSPSPVMFHGWEVPNNSRKTLSWVCSAHSAAGTGALVFLQHPVCLVQNTK